MRLRDITYAPGSGRVFTKLKVPGNKPTSTRAVDIDANGTVMWAEGARSIYD